MVYLHEQNIYGIGIQKSRNISANFSLLLLFYSPYIPNLF